MADPTLGGEVLEELAERRPVGLGDVGRLDTQGGVIDHRATGLVP
jgi:hypothetical protein